MQILFFILFLGLASFSVNAQTTQPPTDRQRTDTVPTRQNPRDRDQQNPQRDRDQQNSTMNKDWNMNDNRAEVKQSDLPGAVQTTLAGKNYKDWKFKNAYRVNTGNQEYYEIMVDRGNQRNTLKIDTNGKIIPDNQ